MLEIRVSGFGLRETPSKKKLHMYSEVNVAEDDKSALRSESSPILEVIRN